MKPNSSGEGASPVSTPDYGRLWQDLLAKYGSTCSERELRAIHIRWKKLAAQASQPGGKSI